MKYILHIAAKLDIGGAEKVARDIGLYPDPDEYQNHYVVFGEEVGAYEQQLLEYGCKIFHMNSPGISYSGFLKSLNKLMQTYPYTAVHAHTMFNAGWAMYAAKKVGVPVRIAHSHSALENGGNWKVRAYETAMRYLILTCATDLVACGEKAGLRLFGEKAYRQRGRLILNGIDVDAFQFDADTRNQMREKIGLKDNFVIGHMGHLADVKNQKYLIERMPEILERRPNAKLLLLGEGKDRAMLERRIQELDLWDAVIMTGNVMNVADYLCAMDVFAFPSLYEGMPLSIIEVQANGLPCVLSTGVPKDVHLTDLVCAIPLEKADRWIEEICGSKRKNSESYAQQLERAGLDITSAMKKIYQIYAEN